MENVLRQVRSKASTYPHAGPALTAATAILLITLQLTGIQVSPVNAGMINMLLVLVFAATYGVRTGFIVATFSAITVNFFFLQPIFGFDLSDLQHVAAGPVFYISAAIGAALRPPATTTQDAAIVAPSEIEPLATTVIAESAPAAEETTNVAAPPEAKAGLVIEHDNRVVSLDGGELRLTPTEFALLHYFTCNPGRILTREAILRSVWGEEYADDVRILRTYVNQLRNKLGDNVAAPRFIRTEPGFGYRFVGPET